MQLIDEIKYLSAEAKNAQVVVCGDFNTAPEIMLKLTDNVRRTIAFKSMYPTISPEGRTYITKTNRGERMIDYILFGAMKSNTHSDELKLIGFIEPVCIYGEKLTAQQALNCPSDHCSLYGVLQFVHGSRK